ncbi:MAG: exodeoxyribonuclease V subunit alpha [Chlorobiaceae bacterium]
MMIEFHERPIDGVAASFLSRGAGPEAEQPLRLVISLLSQATGKGSICLDLGEIAGRTISIQGRAPLNLPNIEQLLGMVRSLESAGRPGEHRPLILDEEGRLYLYRYWRYEDTLARNITLRARVISPGIDESRLADGLERLFSGDAIQQKLAASAALHRAFTVISGGPGTGKTSTVVRIIALLLEQPEGLHHRFALVAPTGKAAARLKSSIAFALESINCDEQVRNAIPLEVSTIHRLLGSRPGDAGYRYSARNTLSYDTVIVDEASMVDLPLMTALLTALRPDARIILLGDRNQLSSVEAGSVLADICSRKELQKAGGLDHAVNVLDKSFRFEEGSPIWELSQAINAGNGMKAMALLKECRSDAICWKELSPGEASSRERLLKMLQTPAIEAYRELLRAASPREAIALFERFRILCALREGPFGINAVNSAIEQILGRRSLVECNTPYYRGRPIIITANDYTLKLFNGDTGIIFPDPLKGNDLMAFIQGSDGALRSIPPERLPAHETAFAMTVHKSQGSEFQRVLLILPPLDSEILTRELLYTAVTRAKTSVELWSSEAIFCSAVRKKIVRNSGLKRALITLAGERSAC